MDSADLTPEQAKRIGRELRYLARLRQRMERGFTPANPLYAATCRAWNAVHKLHVRALYASCSSGVAKGGMIPT